MQVPAIAAVDYGSLGLKVTDLSADAAKRAGLPKEVKGVVIAEVSGEQPRGASRARARPGDPAGEQDAGRISGGVPLRDRAGGARRGRVLHVLKPNGDVDFVILQYAVRDLAGHDAPVPACPSSRTRG